MEETVFPPSPSWFLPNIIAARKDGSVCYGSKNNIVILKSEESKKMELLIIPSAHSLRITAVAFCPSNCSESIKNTIVSSSEDGFVKLWKIDTLTPTIGHKCHQEQKGEIGKIISLDWSTANPHYIISAAENNTLVLWEILSNTTLKFSFQKLAPTIVSCCPYNEKIVAVGGKMGQIYLISLTGNGEVLYRLRGHDNKINSLSWCPIGYNVFKVNEIHEEFLLASACQNKEVFIWRAGSDGKCEAKFQVPTSPLCKKDGQHHAKVGNGFSYVALSWLEPNKIYLSSNFGELIYFDIKSYVLNKRSSTNAEAKSNKQYFNFVKLGHSFHSKGLFAIAGTPVTGEAIMYKNMKVKSELKFSFESNNIGIKKTEDGSDRNAMWDIIMPQFSTLLWTAGQDRKLIGCEIKPANMKIVFNYHTSNGIVYCAVVSPHDPNKIAVGAGDGMIRLWNLTEPNGDIQLYWQKIKDRVMSLDWHPVKDGILAYGTSEGRVGLIDTKSNKLPNVFKPSHPQPIYKLSWGPQFSSDGAKISTSKLEFDLYSVGDNTLSLYNCSKLNDDPLNLSKIIAFPCKKQTDVSWKPDYSLMAVGSEDGSVCLVEPTEFKIVYTLLAYKKLIESIAWHPSSTSVDTDLSPFHGYFTSGSTDNDCDIRVFNFKKEEMEVKVEQVATLKGHHGHVQSVSWSPHISGHLVSNSADGSVQIWDVVSETPLVNFTPKGMPVFSIWSPIDPDFILTGCKNDFFCVWRVSTQTQTSPQANVKAKKHKKEKTIHLSTPKELMDGGTEMTKISRKNEDEIIAVAETKTTAKSSKEMKMFSKIWKGDENEELKTCYMLLRNEETDRKRNYSLPFLCDEDNFKDSIMVEEESLKKSNNWTEFCELALWNGNIKDVLEERIKTGQLNDFLVSLAPAVSPRIWQQACLSYSKSLAEKKFYRKAASYLIICHKIYEAIHLLMNAGLYLEAFCIARSRFPSSDPILNEIITKYAEWLFKNGSFLKACQCYIYLEDYLEVAKVCGKKSQAEYLSLAALAAKKCSSFDLECTEATNALLKCLESNNFELARQVCEDHSNLHHLGLVFFVYHTIHQLDTGELKLDKDIVSHVRESFCTKTVTFPSCLPKLFHKFAFYKNKRQVYIIVAQELSFAACSETLEETITHIIKALSTCSRLIQNSGTEVQPLYKLCVWLSPDGFLSSASFFTLQNGQISSKIKSLRSFLCASIVRHLSDNKETEGLLKSLDLLLELKEDLLYGESYRYFKNLLEAEVCEKRLLKNRNKLFKTLANGKLGPDPNLTHQDQVNGQSFENNVSEAKTPVENVDAGKKPENSEVDAEVKLTDAQFERENLENFEEASEDYNGAETEEENDLEKIVSSDLDLLSRLKSEIESFERVSISSPNPVTVYFLLKTFCERIPENDSAKVLLQFLEKKWQELN